MIYDLLETRIFTSSPWHFHKLVLIMGHISKILWEGRLFSVYSHKHVSQEQNNKRKNKKQKKNPDGNEKSHSWTKSLVIGFDLIEIGINIVSQRLGLV